MKFSAAIFFILLCQSFDGSKAQTPIESVMTFEEYMTKVNEKTERITYLMSIFSCYFTRELHSCQLALYDKQTLQALSTDFMKAGTSGLELLQSSLQGFSRKRRSVDPNVTQSKHLTRKKRGIPGNPCAADIANQVAVLYAIDVETGFIVELLQDPVTLVYQTFFIYDCIISAFLTFPCVDQYVQYMAVVFTGNGNEVANRQVKIPTNCGIQVIS
ncbi:unnamed protein product [Clavelina lepadiformis]|uniref:Uncharacterized protein n=1 Tax=Clavelina lepadiformis TaxID=159417 RepID=A0ABP0FGZ3_CLALP